MRSNHLVVDRVPIDQLRPIEPAVRRHTKKQLEKLRKGLARFGQVLPIPVTPDFRIIDLELVWRAQQENGESHVDVVIIEGKTREEVLALRLALNRIAQDGVWDDPNLRTVLLDLVAVDFDLDLTGFAPPEIDQHVNLDIPEANVTEDADALPPVEETVVSTPGMIWALGQHRVGCGSATDPAFVAQVVSGRRANVAFVDPPYNVPVNGFISGKGKHLHHEFVQGSGELSEQEFFGLLRDSHVVLKVNCIPSALIYTCMDWRHVMPLIVAGHASGLQLYNICVWVKNNGGMGGIYRNAHELICVFRAGDEPPLNNVELGRYGRNRTNVWSYAGLSSFGKDRDASLGMHPTVKPVALISDALRDVTKRGDVVLDTFLGSGSTLIAAQETGRLCCGVELDPRYVDVTVRRWQTVTGLDAVLTTTGESFNATAQRFLAVPSGSNHDG